MPSREPFKHCLPFFSPSPDKAVVEDSKMNEKDWNNLSDTKKMLHIVKASIATQFLQEHLRLF